MSNEQTSKAVDETPVVCNLATVSLNLSNYIVFADTVFDFDEVSVSGSAGILGDGKCGKHGPSKGKECNGCCEKTHGMKRTSKLAGNASEESLLCAHIL
jgi:hypothetical protein